MCQTCLFLVSQAGELIAGDLLGTGSINILGATANSVQMVSADVDSDLTLNLLSGGRLTTGRLNISNPDTIIRGTVNAAGVSIISKDTTFLDAINTTGNQLIQAGTNVSYDGVMTGQSGVLTVGGIIESVAKTGTICIEHGAPHPELATMLSKERAIGPRSTCGAAI